MKVNNNQLQFTELARFAKAMSHPVRLQILDILSKSACCYTGDITDELPIARSTLSQHIKELKDSGLIQGEYNPPKIKYCLNQQNWEKAKEFFTIFLNQNTKSTNCEI
ncbi:MAG: metalloregulator ArsR/SmtB family transcription factor [Salinivirgaceae bacterium]|jgi:ArsR family transcriptional regulator|nr:metalloregulator ArsR/SmtB family transcription factor [Salinivirgaceae bacterium]